MGYDDVVLHIGEFGRYQRRIYFLLYLPAISCAFHNMGAVFLAAKPDFRCLLPHEDPENVTFLIPPDVANSSYPWDYHTKSWSQCERYELDLTDEYHAFGGNQLSGMHSTVKCDSFVYDKSEYVLTVTTEWNLVCDKAWLKTMGDSLFMVGVMLGSLIFGALSDRYGRKATSFLALFVQLIGGILVAVSPNLISYMISRLIVGSTTSGVFLVAYVIALEMVGPKKRLAAGTCIQLVFTLGYILVTGLAYFIRSWRTLQIAFTVPSIFFLGYWRFIPESPRWLLTKGRLQEVKRLMQKASLENGVELSEDTLDNMLNNHSMSRPDPKKSSVFDLLRYPNLRKKFLLLAFTWFVISGTYYGLSWNTSNLGGNNYVNFAIAAIVEIPAHLFFFLTLDRWGRKIVVCGCMFFAGASLLCKLLIPADMQWMAIVLAMFGKFAITASYDAVYIFAAEQFPTVVRNVGLGFCSTFARLGGVIAPHINHLAEVWKPLPLIIFGSCALIASLLSCLLPETLNRKLPESILDGELFGQGISRTIPETKRRKDIDIIELVTVPENDELESPKVLLRNNHPSVPSCTIDANLTSILYTTLRRKLPSVCSS